MYWKFLPEIPHLPEGELQARLSITNSIPCSGCGILLHGPSSSECFLQQFLVSRRVNLEHNYNLPIKVREILNSIFDSDIGM